MKNLLFLILLIAGSVSAQTYVKVADQVEYKKYCQYCDSLTRVEIVQWGKATVVKPPSFINYELYKSLRGDYSGQLLKDTIWYPAYKYGNLSTAISLTKDQVMLHRFIIIQVPRRVKSIADFYANWKTGLIQKSWLSSR